MNPAEELMAVHLDELGLWYQRQYQYVPGRRFRADFAVWVEDLGMYGRSRLALIEIVGGVYKKGKRCPLCQRTDKGAHGSVTGVLKDIERLNLATENGWRMLRFTPQQVESGEAKETVGRTLRRERT